ncbi:MAG: hypothetical protein IRZ10_05450 [Thermoflavifilum sp.]|nr:hypothetical protein [Thermoflavifilum sp.]MCL6513847.1 hypothetical protein [Alicyclobacillus sp.]
MKDTTQRFTCVLCGAETERHADDAQAWEELCGDCVDRWVRDSQAEW